MPTPSRARLLLNQAVFVSTRSPNSISVPMVMISARSILFFRSFCIPVFYNPSMNAHQTNKDLLATADSFVRDRLSEKRLAHTLRVADTAETSLKSTR